jgi:hypothetical protein
MICRIALHVERDIVASSLAGALRLVELTGSGIDL